MGSIDAARISELIDRSKRLPMYMQMADSIEKLIEANLLSPGDALPTEAEMCKGLEVSAVTVKKGLALLVQKGIIRRISGRGTFVSSQAAPRDTEPPSDKMSIQGEGHFGMLVRHDEYKLPAQRDACADMIRGFERTINTHGGIGRYIMLHPDGTLTDDTLLDQLNAVAIFDTKPHCKMPVEISKLAARRQIRYIMVTSTQCTNAGDNIYFDGARLGFLAVTYLASIGYTHFILAGIEPTDGSTGSDCRLVGMHDAAHLSGLSASNIRLELAPEQPDHLALGEKLAARIGKLKPRTGIVTCSDSIAVAIMKKLEQRGHQCGNDYALIGCGDDPTLRHHGISTFALPWQKAGELAARRLLGILDDSPGTLRYALWPSLLRRNTTPAVNT